MRTASTGIEWGVAADLGKRVLRIRGPSEALTHPSSTPPLPSVVSVCHPLASLLSDEPVLAMRPALCIALALSVVSTSSADPWPTRIVIAKEAPEVVRLAASELQYCLTKISGSRLPIVSDDAAEPGPCIFVGRSRLTDALNLEADALYPEGFVVASVDNGLVILGEDHDRPSRGPLPIDPRQSHKGTLFGVYRFLEECLGVRWLWPGETGEVVPVQRPFKWPVNVQIRDKPKMLWRHLFLCSGSNLTAEDQKAIQLWYLRMGMGVSVGTPYSFQHSWLHHLRGNRHFAAHPEYFSLLKGRRTPFPLDEKGKPTRGSQLCTTTAEVTRLIAARLRSRYSTMVDTIVSLSPNDGLGFCECRKCREIDRPGLYEKHQGYHGLVLSDRIFSFVSGVARRVRTTHPDLRMGCFAYTVARPAPRGLNGVDPNVAISFTQEISRFSRDPELRERHRQRLDRWLACGNKVIIRDYLGYYGFGNILAPQTRWIADYVQSVARHRKQILGCYSETMCSDLSVDPLNYYVLAKLCWDPSRSREQIVSDYFAAGFDKAAARIRDFYGLLESKYCAAPSQRAAHFTGVDRWLTEDVVAQARSLLGQAKVLADDEAIRRRISAIEKAFTHTTQAQALISNCKAMIDHGLTLRIRGYVPRPVSELPGRSEIVSLIERTEQSYKTLVGTIDALEKDRDFIFSGDAFRRIAKTARWEHDLAHCRQLYGDQTKELHALPLVWRFKTDPGASGLRNRWLTVPLDASWAQLRIDDFWEKQGYAEGGREGYNGIAWYRLDDYLIPASAAGKRITLWLGAVDESCWVYVNGKEVGQLVYDAAKDPDSRKKPISFDITSLARPDARNSFAVRVEDRSGMGGIWRKAWLVFEPKHGETVFSQTFDDDTWRERASVRADSATFKLSDDGRSLHVTATKGLPSLCAISWGGIKVSPSRTYTFSMSVRTANVRENAPDLPNWQRCPGVPQVRIIPQDTRGKPTARPNQYQWIRHPFAESMATWRTLRRVFRLPPNTAQVSVTIFLHAQGQYWLDSLYIRTFD